MQSTLLRRTGPCAPAIEVPEHPALAPDVQLAGEMPDGGFKDRQWLIQRDGRFIHVTELLYRVAEQADGRRTLEEIAAGLTEATDWSVSADHVRQLVRKLIPVGIIAAPAASTPSFSQAPAAGRARSPLALNLRVKVLSPRVIDPITRILQVLYAPPLLLPLLLVIAVAHGWLYLVHGIGPSALDIVYRPVLLLAVIPVAVAANVFHEFGHAAALRYGGGKVRGIGFGFYLIYPAFYTDTTDSYRLGRWAKVRTDLGGFYFSLLSALGIMACYKLSGWEFLLFAVFLINIDVIYQCLPHVRMDGYWALAALTGIPDLFSYMKAFLRGALPVPGVKGERLPGLKPWVKGVFTAYIVFTLPVLVLLSFLFITRAPHILATVWDSLVRQGGQLSWAFSRGDAGGALLAAMQMLLLALSAFGVAYTLYNLGRRLAAPVWRWGTQPLRVAYAPFFIIAAVAAAAAGSGAWWYYSTGGAAPASQASVGEPGAAPPHVRGRADAPVTLEEFGDFQCPPCGALHPELKRIEAEYGDRVRVIFRQYPVEQLHRNAVQAARASEAAALQGHFWEMHDYLYEHQRAWFTAEDARPFLTGAAQSLGLDVERFARDMESEQVSQRIRLDRRRGESLGVTGTPTLFLNGRITPFVGGDRLRADIDAALSGKR